MTLAVDMSVLLRLSFAHFLFDPLLFLCLILKGPAGVVGTADP